ncbi:MAG: NAD(P)-dependent oxidoreductase [Flavobacteriaceae bacterium]
MKLGIIRERKNPPDKRVVLSPEACKMLQKEYPSLEIIVEPSPIRTFKDQQYMDAGIQVGDVGDCEVLVGVKEVPIENLIPNKKYFFFSHTIKKQPYNRKLLQAVVENDIQLFDHEVLTNEQGQRVVAFGRYAGIVGAFNGIRAYGLKKALFVLPKAEDFVDQKALISALRKVDLGPARIVLTGKGRVGNGAKEMLDGMGIKELSSDDFLNNQYPHAVYTQIDVLDYNKRKDGQLKDKEDFFKNPQDYESDFMKYAESSDFFIAGHFFGDGSPYLFTREDAKRPEFKIEVIADVSCDIDGPVASTIRPSTIEDPIYGYNPQTEKEDDYRKLGVITVMAVDNLPCELPQDASVGFGEQFSKNVIPALLDGDQSGILERARMTKNKSLTPRYSYLSDYLAGKE